MLSERIQETLNKQIEVEAKSSMHYLSMASWAEANGYPGAAAFLYRHSDEERGHMLKLVKFVNDRGGHAVIPALDKPQEKFDSLTAIFEGLLNHEIEVSKSINDVIGICLEEKDYTTQNFMQWYVSEQIEEEGLARTIVDKLKLIGDSSNGIYLFDRELQGLMPQHEA